MTSLYKLMFFVECSVRLAALVGRQGRVMCFDGGGSDSSSYSEVIHQLDKQLLKKKTSPDWLTGRSAVVGVPTADETPDASLLWKSIEGFFRGHYQSRNNKKSPAHERRNRTRYYSNLGESDENETEVIRDPIATTTDNPNKKVFGAENECVLANDGRSCVCFMTDFLDLVCRRLDEEVVNPMYDDNAEKMFLCPSYKVVPTVFVISSSMAVTVNVVETITATAVHVLGQCAEEFDFNSVEPTWKQVDFNEVINYQLEKPKDENYAVHYALVGSDVKVKCTVDSENIGISAFVWDYKKDKHKSNSTITGTDTSHLLILGFEPRDSKNYTCVPSMHVAGKLTNGSAHTHYVLAVDKPNYEIRGTAIYKTNDVDGCTHEIINPIKKQLPGSVRTEICSDGPLQYACNVVIDTPKCFEDRRTLEINYVITLNDRARHLTWIKTSQISRSVLTYQKMLARIFNVLVENLNKTLAVQIVSKSSSSDTNFKPVYGGINVTSYVSCAQGFGIREVFCGVCPPHHFSPDKRAECLKCPRGFHQPIAGSAKCVKCPNLFASGCYMTDVSSIWYYITGFICLIICSIIVVSCLCCCREEYETNIRIIPRKIRSKFKRKKKYHIISSDETVKSSGSKWDKLRKLKKKIKLNNKPKHNKMESAMSEIVQNKVVGQYTPKTDIYHYTQNN